jgi:Cof subfamily protein (haloacid dehalogenase superfamily)
MSVDANPGLGMLGASLRHRGEDLLGRLDEIEAFARTGRTCEYSTPCMGRKAELVNTQPLVQASTIRLVIADVDGTLVTHDKVLTARAISSVSRLREANVLFAITSGRPPKGMKMLVDALDLSEPISAFNGGVVINMDYSVVASHCVSSDLAAEVIRLMGEHGLDVWLYSDTDWYVRDPNAPHVAREQWTVKFPPMVVSDFEAHLEHVVKIVGVSDDLPAVARCEMEMQAWGGARISAERSQPYYLDVTHPNANKGEVVLMLSKLLSIPPEQIATIGDMPNDVLMFHKSGVSIAMGNASTEVQKAATYVTTSNEEEGFANAMERFVLRESSQAR